MDAEATTTTAKPVVDKFYCDEVKFKKMMRFFKTVRDAQKNYFKLKNQDSLKAAKMLEKKVDETLEFYLENLDKLHNCPF